MRTFSRIGIVSAAAFTGLFAPSAIGRHQPVHSVVCTQSGQAFAVSDARGRYLALHFLNGNADSSARLVTEYLRESPASAGVRHIFIRAGDAAAIKEWSDRLTDGAGSIYLDDQRKLSTELKAMGPAFVSIVFDKQGKELFRTQGTHEGSFAPWRLFADELAAKTTLPALKDYNLPSGRPLALEGYDVVSYFKSGRAVKGKRELTSSYEGVLYQFSTPENRKLFATEPERYLPTYGGWCASAMGAKGTKVEIDPTNFKIKDGRLFLFYKGTFSDALKDWNKREKEWEPAADANWKKLTSEDPRKPPNE